MDDKELFSVFGGKENLHDPVKDRPPSGKPVMLVWYQKQEDGGDSLFDVTSGCYIDPKVMLLVLSPESLSPIKLNELPAWLFTPSEKFIQAKEKPVKGLYLRFWSEGKESE